MLSSTKPARCRHCKQRTDSRTRLIHEECIDAWLEAEMKRKALKKEKETRVKVKVERVLLRQYREANKSIADRIAEAQKEFNAYIRLRDRGLGCIDCGKPFEPQRPGGSIDAGHWLSRGGNTHLRFNEDNCFAQRKNCNRPGGTTRAAFRAGVVARIGEERAVAVESSYEVHKWTHSELIAIKEKYRQKAKELKAELE